MKNKKGGEVFATGGFGCVFSPALKCEGKQNRNSKNTISKLMTEKHTLEEYNEIQNIKKKLKDIKNYSNYFLLDNVSVCKPSKLTQSDLRNFGKKCTALPKDNITRTNINESLDKLLLLNMPNGGIPVDDFIHENGSFTSLYKLNSNMIELLTKGIIPMNKRNVYHCDIKDSNVLVEGLVSTKLIDWGLSTEYIPFKNNVFPKTWRNRPLQYNVPFSVILFTDSFVQQYTKYIEEGGKTTENALRPFVVDYIFYWMRERGVGHYGFINEVMYILFSKDLIHIYDDGIKYKLIESNFTIVYITNYIINVLLHFTKFRDNKTLDLRFYLDNVFINTIDIWGFLSTYYPFLECFYNSYDILSEQQLKAFNLIKYLFVNYLYTPTIKPIDVTGVIKELKLLDQILLNESLLERNIKKSSFTKTTSSHVKTSKINFKKITNKNTRRVKDLLLLTATKKKYKTHVK